jgi:hypothetical protein
MAEKLNSIPKQDLKTVSGQVAQTLRKRVDTANTKGTKQNRAKTKAQSLVDEFIGRVNACIDENVTGDSIDTREEQDRLCSAIDELVTAFSSRFAAIGKINNSFFGKNIRQRIVTLLGDTRTDFGRRYDVPFGDPSNNSFQADLDRHELDLENSFLNPLHYNLDLYIPSFVTGLLGDRFEHDYAISLSRDELLDLAMLFDSFYSKLVASLDQVLAELPDANFVDVCAKVSDQLMGFSAARLDKLGPGVLDYFIDSVVTPFIENLSTMTEFPLPLSIYESGQYVTSDKVRAQFRPDFKQFSGPYSGVEHLELARRAVGLSRGKRFGDLRRPEIRRLAKGMSADFHAGLLAYSDRNTRELGEYLDRNEASLRLLVEKEDHPFGDDEKSSLIACVEFWFLALPSTSITITNGPDGTNEQVIDIGVRGGFFDFLRHSDSRPIVDEWANTLNEETHAGAEIRTSLTLREMLFQLGEGYFSTALDLGSDGDLEEDIDSGEISGDSGVVVEAGADLATFASGGPLSGSDSDGDDQPFSPLADPLLPRGEDTDCVADLTGDDSCQGSNDLVIDALPSSTLLLERIARVLDALEEDIRLTPNSNGFARTFVATLVKILAMNRDRLIMSSNQIEIFLSVLEQFIEVGTLSVTHALETGGFVSKKGGKFTLKNMKIPQLYPIFVQATVHLALSSTVGSPPALLKGLDFSQQVQLSRHTLTTELESYTGSDETVRTLHSEVIFCETQLGVIRGKLDDIKSSQQAIVQTMPDLDAGSVEFNAAITALTTARDAFQLEERKVSPFQDRLAVAQEALVDARAQFDATELIRSSLLSLIQKLDDLSAAYLEEVEAARLAAVVKLDALKLEFDSLTE